MNNQQLALKEWAVTVNALLAGDLIFVLRKGGIHEETKKFELKAPSFMLMPAFEHQKEHLLKPSYQGQIMDTIKQYEAEPEQIVINGYAEVVEDIELYNEQQLERIYNEHIWTHQFAEERLKWKKREPLHLLILRVYKYETPIKLQMEPSYTGCKSWITVEQSFQAGQANVVLKDEQFKNKYDRIKDCLHQE